MDEQTPLVEVADIAAEIMVRMPVAGPQLVGLDGPGAAGKSTLAGLLAAHWPRATVVHLDDFYRLRAERPANAAPGDNYDRPRLVAQVLEPLAHGRPGRYQRYDWDLDALLEWHDVPGEAPVIVEGVYSTSAPLRHFYGVRLWVTAPYALRLQRGVARDGEEMRSMWTQTWMPAEATYIDTERPHHQADLVLNAAGALPGGPTYRIEARR